jgi:alkyl sulfatase BDS1-like metallo-beta-lactamase superfamily hydrolase
MNTAPDNRKDASGITIDRNAALAQGLNWNDQESFENASRGFLATWDPLTVTNSEGDEIWTLVPYLPPIGTQTPDSAPPPTVNPSLWRQAQLNSFNGLFEVCEGIYQIRAFDMSNMTIIEGRTGLIIIDPLISVECAQSALKLYRDNRPSAAGLEVTAVIYTHSHIDHFGGVEGIMPLDPAKRAAVEIYAPQGFLEHAVSENVYAGCAMGRRAQYMYGPILSKDDKGQVDTGLGKGQSTGSVSLYPPTVDITQTGDEFDIAGVRVVFHMTPGSEAPAEMDFYFPDFKAFCAAENATHNMHNIQTLRGANVRDALKWSKYLGEALELFGREAEVLFASHHWPIWGQANVANFLGRQRDMYRYLNDQTLRMLNKGYTGIELAEVFEMPASLAADWSCRGYYGSVSHNSKAVYDKYMGWFDGDPSNLHRLTPEDAAHRYVRLMGGPEAVIEAAREAGEAGEYRWAAELIRHVVFDRTCTDQAIQSRARDLQADVLEQMGYQAECATWRNFFLAGAKELRSGIQPPGPKPSSPTMIAAMTTAMIFDALATKLIGPWVGERPISMNWIFIDPVDPFLVRVQNGALTYVEGKLDQNADVTLMLSRDTLNRLMAGLISLQEAIGKKLIDISGRRAALLRFFCLLDSDDPAFPIVTPRPDARRAWLALDRLETIAGVVDGTASEDTMMAHPAITQARLFIGELPRGC